VNVARKGLIRVACPCPRAGTLEQKMAPWLRPMYDVFYKVSGVKGPVQRLPTAVSRSCERGYT
jgi:hypothetical protein